MEWIRQQHLQNYQIPKSADLISFISAILPAIHQFSMMYRRQNGDASRYISFLFQEINYSFFIFLSSVKGVPLRPLFVLFLARSILCVADVLRKNAQVLFIFNLLFDVMFLVFILIFLVRYTSYPSFFFVDLCLFFRSLLQAYR